MAALSLTVLAVSRKGRSIGEANRVRIPIERWTGERSRAAWAAVLSHRDNVRLGKMKKDVVSRTLGRLPVTALIVLVVRPHRTWYSFRSFPHANRIAVRFRRYRKLEKPRSKNRL
ncbi:MAG: hypothetical protein HZA46_04890 [Planctomycetales bacterium]|nr:hypothetical protein [Planctomycetales bacterium]